MIDDSPTLGAPHLCCGLDAVGNDEMRSGDQRLAFFTSKGGAAIRKGASIMMKLSTMRKIVDTVDANWHSPLAETIAERWGFDQGSVEYFRASANFVFTFHRKGRTYFLRFNDSKERSLPALEAEMAILHYLKDQPLRTAQPVLSRRGEWIETVETDAGVYFAVVFEGLPGTQYDFGEFPNDQFIVWGQALGRLHRILKKMPKRYYHNRASWRDHLLFARETIPAQDAAAVTELERVMSWADNLSLSESQMGIIHFDFELDNLRWDNGVVGMLDFDDCAQYWYAADIAFALRDLFDEGAALDDRRMLEFIKGYTRETDLDSAALQHLPWLRRLHDLVSYASLLRSVDIEEMSDDPEWLIRLRNRLNGFIAAHRASFEG